jgi:hypothetical protein
MKPEGPLSTRYADLMTDPSDEALGQLIQELDATYTAPARPEGLSWSTVSPHMASKPHLTEVISERHQVWPVRRRNAVLIACAAVLMIALFSATMFGMRSALWIQQPHPISADKQAIQQLMQNQDTPENIRSLAQNGQFTPLNATKVTQAGSVMISQAFADANNVVLVYTIDSDTWLNPPGACSPQKCILLVQISALTVTTSDGHQLKEHLQLIDFDKEISSKRHRVAILSYFDASAIQGNPKQVQVTISLSKDVSPSQEAVGTFTIPFHPDKTVIPVNQTTNANGVPITLEQIVISTTEVRCDFDYDSMPASKRDILQFYPETLSVAGTAYPIRGVTPDNTGFSYIPLQSNDIVSFLSTLQSQTGKWVLAISDLNGVWTFTFTVS